MLAHCSSHAFEFSLLFMLELRFSAGYSYGDSFRKKNKRGPPSVEVMFRLVLECVFLPVFFRKRDSWPFDLLFLFNVFDIMMKSMLFRFFHSWIKQTMAISEIRKRVGVNNVFCIKFGFQMFSFHVYMTCSSLSKRMGHAVFRLWVKRLVWLSSSIAWETVGCKGLCHPCFPLVGASLCNWNVT